MNKTLVTLCFFFFISPVSAETLYQQHVKNAKISDKAVQKAFKQVKEYKEIEVANDLSVPPFHQRGQQQIMQKKTFCLMCHPALSHHKNERSRTFMNMHSRYIACETCHFRPKGIILDYRWLAYEGLNVGQELLSRIVKPEMPVQMLDEKKTHAKDKFKTPVSLSPQPGARIAPFSSDAPVLLFKDSSFAQQVEDEWGDQDAQTRAELKARLHAPLEKKGLACQQCHGKTETILDLNALGATPERLRALQNNTIVRFFDRFEKEGERIRINRLLR